jgi:predicted esterase
MEEHLTLELTTRAHVLLDVPERVDAILIGFHGYGGGPERALAALREVGVPNLLRVAPMGPHHFYDRRQNVVASWMTRFRRDEQIDQQVQYVQRLEESLRTRFGLVPLFVFGFSQGVAVTYRAAVMAKLNLARVFCLGGDMPPEVRDALLTAAPIPVTLLRGTQDRAAGAAAMDGDLARLQAEGWPAELHEVSGAHDYLRGALEIVTTRIVESLE